MAKTMCVKSNNEADSDINWVKQSGSVFCINDLNSSGASDMLFLKARRNRVSIKLYRLDMGTFCENGRPASMFKAAALAQRCVGKNV